METHDRARARARAGTDSGGSPRALTGREPAEAARALRDPASAKTDAFRELCPACLRPIRVCCCASIEPLPTSTRVLILQHPRERKVGVNTARIAQLSLPNSVLRFGVDFDGDPVVQALLHDPDRPAALLFPGADAVDLAAHPPTGPITLVVLDGTWWQASKLLRANPDLKALPRLALALSEPSRYRIRTQPAEHCVSTIEALAAALVVLERDAGMQRLLVPFEHMVEAQLDYARRSGGGSRHARSGPPGQPRPWQWLSQKPERVILAAGETNQWPRHAREGLPEIVHWAAIRPSTGEKLEAVIRPAQRLAPSCPVQIELSREAIDGGVSFDEFASAWRAFAGIDDLVCTWGRHAGDVAARQGLPFGPRLDLRAFTIRHLRRRVGEMPAYAQALGAVAGVPWAQGRAGKRLAVLEGIAAALAERLAR